MKRPGEKAADLLLSAPFWCFVILLLSVGAALAFDRNPVLAAFMACLAIFVGVGLIVPRPHASA